MRFATIRVSIRVRKFRVRNRPNRVPFYLRRLNMDYMTVKEASEKWKLSERMIRKYCDQDRIEGVIHVSGVWAIPVDAPQPNETKPEVIELTPLAKKIVYQRNKNNHFGIYEYIQVNLAYSSNRMASNRLTRQQVEEVYRTNKVATAFEPMKVDDLIEVLTTSSASSTWWITSQRR